LDDCHEETSSAPRNGASWGWLYEINRLIGFAAVIYAVLFFVLAAVEVVSQVGWPIIALYLPAAPWSFFCYSLEDAMAAWTLNLLCLVNLAILGMLFWWTKKISCKEGHAD